MKYKFSSIGDATAAIIIAALAANPSTTFLATGICGKIIFYIAKTFSMILANYGLIILNVGAAKIEVIIDQEDYDGSWEKADAIINKIKNSGRELTDDEKKAIDQPVIDAFKRFASFGRGHKRL